jgi:hypothetical protein
VVREEISNLILDIINDFWNGGEPPPDWKDGTIVTIYKNKGSPSELSSYRPITLLNYDYKLCAALIAERMQPIAQKQIGWQQAGFVRGRLIFDNVLNVEEAFYEAKHQGLRAVASPVDFKSAFDSFATEAFHATYAHAGCPRRPSRP